MVVRQAINILGIVPFVAPERQSARFCIESNMPEMTAHPPVRAPVAWFGLFAGPVIALVFYVLLPRAVVDDAGVLLAGLTDAGRATAAVAALMACWWLTEAIPISATALLPLPLFPLLGITTMRAAAAPYANELIFLFFGGFCLGLAMQRWGLHRRIALLTIRIVGDSPGRLVAGFMIATALLSGWVSNTATVLLMLPIASSVLAMALKEDIDTKTPLVPGLMGHNFGLCLLLGIAYAASVGGVATLIGTPPNLILAAYVKSHYDFDLSMAKWMLVGVPLMVVFLPIVWLLLTKVLFPIRIRSIEGVGEHVRTELREMGRLSRGEWIVLIIFALTASAWITRPLMVQLGESIGFAPLARLNDTAIAMLAALALFVIPVHPKQRVFTIDWETAEKIPWGVLLLFGGGLSLAAAITLNGVDTFIGNALSGLGNMPGWLIILMVTATVIFLTEITSNTAVTTALLPVLAAAAIPLGVEPLALLVPAAIAASFAFMLPIATPPNAIVFSTGRLRIPHMARAGLVLNLLGIVLAAVAGHMLAGILG